MKRPKTGADLRQSFIDFFAERGHTVVPSSSLVPGGDQTLLFTNAGMVQFKDIFLGTDKRPYTRVVDSQKCMRVAGKHNDLDEVGRDDTHHTFFEMLGNWSFGDYYKEDAIRWAWELLTVAWGIDRAILWATYFKDDKGNLPTDDEAAQIWLHQPGMEPSHVIPFGRKDNFWEMAETGPCGPCSEIHIDRGLSTCDKKHIAGHVCRVNGDCRRFLELWNLVFIQYNRTSQTQFDLLPAKHVDTGMGFERVVSLLQNVDSNYKTDLLSPLIDIVQKMTGQTDAEKMANFTPYRVIADHARAAAFLIADGVVPGNTGRNYICRMIIRRAARFGSKIGLNEPFLGRVASVVVDHYGGAYPELKRHREAILTDITREEERFQRTVEIGLGTLEELLSTMQQSGVKVLDGGKAFDLYATLGLPLEITRDIAREQDLDVDEVGFRVAMEEHRVASGAGKAFGLMGSDDVDNYRATALHLQSEGLLPANGVMYDPYSKIEVDGKVLAIYQQGEPVQAASEGDNVEILLPATCFYIESGGQVSDTGTIVSVEAGSWQIFVEGMRRPAAGVIVHVGRVVKGTPRVGDLSVARVDLRRRRDIMRNHTATHLLHAQLQAVLGEHARQAGSLVAPDRLRFDFNHSEAVSPQQLEIIEAGVNQAILDNFHLTIQSKLLTEAISEGATALFGEKYGETVRTIQIGIPEPFSYELCGGTHVEDTGDIGIFLITSEGSAAAGIRRIEAVTGRDAYAIVQKRSRILSQISHTLAAPLEDLLVKFDDLVGDNTALRKQVVTLRQELVAAEFGRKLDQTVMIEGVPVLAAILPNANADTLRLMTDNFRQRYASGVVVLGSEYDGKPMIVAAVTDDLTRRGIMANEIVRVVAQVIGGSGGGRPTLAQAGGKDAGKLSEALDQVIPMVKTKLK
jgi:alanyl-tRNA synthetase